MHRPPHAADDSAPPSADEVTRLLGAMQRGDRTAASRLFELVYHELRALARSQLRRERGGHTLQPTALVHEAWLRLLSGKPPHVSSRSHFLGVAAHAMRRLLVDHARAREASKRGGEWQRVTLDEDSGPARGLDVDLLQLNQALERLEKLSERLVRVVELRFFGGLTVREAAEVLDIAPVTVEKDWTKAKAWLRRELVAT